MKNPTIVNVVRGTAGTDQRPYHSLVKASTSRIRIATLPTEYSSRHLTQVHSHIELMGNQEASRFDRHYAHSFETLDSLEDRKKMPFSPSPLLHVVEGKLMNTKVVPDCLYRFQIDGLGKTLPAMFQLDGASPETSLLVGFGHWPTPQKHDISTTGFRVYIGPEWQSSFVDRYSIRVCIIVKQPIRTQAWVAFSKQAPKLELPPPSVKRSQLNDFSRYLNISLHPAPPRVRPPDWKKSFLMANKESQRLESKQKHLFEIKTSSQVLESKIQTALTKKDQNLEQKKQHLVAQMDRKEKEQLHKSLLISKVAGQAQQVAKLKAWLVNLVHCQVLSDLRGMVIQRKTALLMKRLQQRKAETIQRLWKAAVSSKESPAKEKDELSRIRLVLGIAAGGVSNKARRESAAACGVFFQALHFSIRLNHKCFEYSSQFTILQNKMKRHMRVRQELFRKFLQEFDKCGKEAMVYDRTRGDSYLTENLFKITANQKEAIFDYLFNFSLIGFMKTRLKLLHADEEDNKYAGTGLYAVRGFPGIQGYLQRHELAAVFSKVDQDFKAGLFEDYTDMKHQGTKLSFASRSSASFSRGESKRFEKKAQDTHRTALLRMIENKDLQKVFQTFIGPQANDTLTLSFPRAYYAGIHLRLLESTVGRELATSPSSNTRRTRVANTSLKELAPLDTPVPKSLVNIG